MLYFNDNRNLSFPGTDSFPYHHFIKCFGLCFIKAFCILLSYFMSKY